MNKDSKMQGNTLFPCKTKKIDKDTLELYLKTKYGDKIGKSRNKAKSVLSREFREYMRENKWANLKDTRVDYWWRR